jgi:hypothetical protein
MIGAILHLDEPVPPVKLPGLFCSGMHFNSHSADDFGNLNGLFYCMREKSFSQPSALRRAVDAKLAQEDGRRWVPRKTFGTSKILRKVFELYVARSERIKSGYFTMMRFPAMSILLARPDLTRWAATDIPNLCTQADVRHST